MVLIFVTAAVLSNGTLVRAKQLENMLCMLVTDAVLNKGTVIKEWQPANMLLMLVTDAVLPNTTNCNFRKPPNKFDKFVTLPSERTAARSHIANLTLLPPKVMLVKLGLPTSMSSQPVSYACKPLVVFFTFMLTEVRVPPFGVTVTMACL